MTDEAERWLRDHDPDYTKSRNAWRHIAEGVYKTPAQEVPWDDDYLNDYIDGAGSPQPLEKRACEACGLTFLPRETKQRYCSERCRWRQQKRRQRMSASS